MIFFFHNIWDVIPYFSEGLKPPTSILLPIVTIFRGKNLRLPLATGDVVLVRLYSYF